MLKNISFTAKSGETVAFIGSTGSGKSTLIHLIPRFYDAAAGKILIDGQDIASMDVHRLRDKIGLFLKRPTCSPVRLPIISVLVNRTHLWTRSSMRPRLLRPMTLSWKSLTAFDERNCGRGH